MFKKLLVLSTLFIAFVSQAQNIEVIEFKETQNADARIYEKKDRNDQVCALIKVNTNGIQNLSFDSNLGITEVVSKVGEYWVYVSPKERMLTIMSNELGKISYTFQIAIQSATVYEMSLQSDVQLTVTKTELLPEFVVLETNPAGADVYIGDEYKGISPLPNLMLRPGSYDIRVNKMLYEEYVGKIIIEKDKTNKLNIPLVPNFGELDIKTTPETGARIIVDGKTETNTSNTRIKLSPGSHTIRLEKDMFEPVVKNVTITKGELSQLNISLNATFGNVRISAPSDADVYIDNIHRGKGTWTGRLGSGMHVVDVKKENYQDYVKSIQINAGQDFNLSVELEAKTGILNIQSTPYDASIYIDDELQSQTTPASFRDIMVGSHSIRVSKPGYGSASTTVTVYEGKTIPINLELSQDIEISVTSDPAGAAVYVDGSFKGTTPMTYKATPGVKNEVKLVKGGYYSETKTLDPSSSSNLNVKLSSSSSIASTPNTSSNNNYNSSSNSSYRSSSSTDYYDYLKDMSGLIDIQANVLDGYSLGYNMRLVGDWWSMDIPYLNLEFTQVNVPTYKITEYSGSSEYGNDPLYGVETYDYYYDAGSATEEDAGIFYSLNTQFAFAVHLGFGDEDFNMALEPNVAVYGGIHWYSEYMKDDYQGVEGASFGDSDFNWGWSVNARLRMGFGGTFVFMEYRLTGEDYLISDRIYWATEWDSNGSGQESHDVYVSLPDYTYQPQLRLGIGWEF